MKLINKKINQLEILDSNQECVKLRENIKEKKQIPLNLIPFLMMFVFLNHECKIKNHYHSILKSARYCARKFEMKHTNQYFVKYCSRKINKIIDNQEMPNDAQLASIEGVLNLYDKTFYDTGNILQLDGNDDLSDQEESIPVQTCLYSVNCEEQKISTWLNFFRGYGIVWENSSFHCICDLKKT